MELYLMKLTDMTFVYWLRYNVPWIRHISEVIYVNAKDLRVAFLILRNETRKALKNNEVPNYLLK